MDNTSKEIHDGGGSDDNEEEDDDKDEEEPGMVKLPKVEINCGITNLLTDLASEAPYPLWGLLL